MPETNSVEKVSVTKQTPSKQAGGNEHEAEFRKTVDDNKRLQSKLQQLEQENEQLRTRLLRSESSATQYGGSSKSAVAQHDGFEFKLLHIVISALIALIIGLIAGKIVS